MKKTKLNYGQLDRILRSIGFSCRIDEVPRPGRIYEHEPTGAVISLPKFPLRNRVYEHHIIAVRINLENFGIPIPSVLDAKLKKAG